MEFVQVLPSDADAIRELSALASHIVKKHYDPILGSEQNDYMIEKFQSVHAIEQQLRDGYTYYFACTDAGEKIGFMGFYPRNGGLYLSKFYLLEEYRGRGISREMMGFVIEQAKKIDADEVTLNVNKYNFAQKVYEKLGFHKIRDEKIDIGHGYYMDDFVYEFPLRPGC